MFINKFGLYENVECGLVRILKTSPLEFIGHQNHFKHESYETIPIPLQSVSIVAYVTHGVAEVKVTQTYINKESQPIEAIYYFPLDSNGTVTHFEAELEGRKIRGVVKRTEEAKAQYEKAIEQKQTAFFLEPNKPDIFKVRVGFLKPGSQVKIEIGYVTEVKNEKGSNAIRFFIPTTVAPRYNPRRDSDEKAADLSKMTISESSPAPLSIMVYALIHGKIKGVESPSHEINIADNKQDESRAVITLKRNWATEMDKDFVLLIFPEEVHIPRLYIEKGEDTNALMAHIIPKIHSETELKVELIFVLDRSGSMEGLKIELARKALIMFLHSLPVDCYFNVAGFGSTFDLLFRQSIKYDDDSLKRALLYAKCLQADLGGTEILKPLEYIYSKEPIPGCMRQIFILTDGQVSNTDQVIRICKENAGANRVFALGIGHGASHHLVEGIAEAGQGTADFVVDNEPIDVKVLQQLKNASQPFFFNVNIKWTGISDSSVSDSSEKFWQTPKKIPALFDGSQQLVFGIFPGEVVPSGVLIQGESENGPFSTEIKLDEGNRIVGTMLHKLAAIKAIRALESEMNLASNSYQRRGRDYVLSETLKEKIISTAIKNGLASSCTSFVAVDDNIKSKTQTQQLNENWIMQSRYVPSQVPYGYQTRVTVPVSPWSGSLGYPHMTLYSSTIDEKITIETIPTDASRMSRSNPPIPKSGTPLHSEPIVIAERWDGHKLDEKTFPDEKEESVELRNNEDKLHALIATQSFNGCFKLNQQFSRAVNINLEIIRNECKSGGYGEDAWATALALVYLAQKLNDLKGSWNLIEAKAKKWLENLVTISDLDSIISAAQKFLISSQQ